MKTPPVRSSEHVRGHVQSFQFAAGSKFGLWPVTDNNYYLRLTVEKVRVFLVFTNKHLLPDNYRRTNFAAAVNCTNPKNKVKSEIIETQIIEIQIQFVIK